MVDVLVVVEVFGIDVGFVDVVLLLVIDDDEGVRFTVGFESVDEVEALGGAVDDAFVVVGFCSVEVAFGSFVTAFVLSFGSDFVVVVTGCFGSDLTVVEYVTFGTGGFLVVIDVVVVDEVGLEVVGGCFVVVVIGLGFVATVGKLLCDGDFTNGGLVAVLVATSLALVVVLLG